MKRDWELVRTILAHMESRESTARVMEADEIEGFSQEVVSYHIKLLLEAGLLDASCSKALNGPLRCWATSLTWAGHEFLDQIRSQTLWNKTKDLLKEKGIELSFDAIKMAVKVVISAML